MDKKNIAGQIHSSMYHQLQARGYAAPVDVLIDIGALSKVDCENWRFGRVDYLERVCKVSLSKLSEIMKIIREYASIHDLKASWTFCRQYGCKAKRQLRFSKSGKESIEKNYATHYLDTKAKLDC
jgi:hypothetical protein